MSTKKRRKKRHDTLVLKLLVLVAAVIIVFEGRLIGIMLTHRSVTSDSMVSDSPVSTSSNSTINSGTPGSSRPVTLEAALAGFANPGSTLHVQPTNVITDFGTPQTEASEQTHQTVSSPNSSAIVPLADKPTDDSYFADAVFIGDSRMEGFRNVSGITQGRFFTSVGMSLQSMATGSVISTPQGNITVAAALSGGSYNKIYIMLGTNDLGEGDWNSFHDGFVQVTRRFKEIQPNAMVYICSVIYVEESKVANSNYVNNKNVDTINSILLQICEEEGYHYLNLNEILSNGYGSLIQDASSDGVHMYEKYCKMMLDYLKSHYIPVEEKPAETEISESESETES